MRILTFISLILLGFWCNPCSLAVNDAWLTYTTKGTQAVQSHNPDTAANYFKEALEEAEKSRSDPRLIETLDHLVHAKILQGKAKEAQPFFERAIGIAERAKSVPSNKKSISLWMNDMADFYYRIGESVDNDALKIYFLRHYIDCKLAATDSFDPVLRPRINMLSSYYMMRGLYPEAEQVTQKARITIDRDPKKGELDFWTEQMGKFALLQKRFGEADSYFRDARTVKDRFYPTQKTSHQAVLEQQLGTIDLEKSNWAAAASHLSTAIKLYKAGYDDRGIAFTTYILGLMEDRMGNSKMAAQYFQASLNSCRKWSCPFPALEVMSAAHLANELKKQGNAKGAKAVGAYIDKISAAHSEWGEVSNPDPETFFIICGLLPYPTAIIPSHTHLDLY